jgi:hypothetical protein
MVKWVPMKTNSRGYSSKEERFIKMALILVDRGKPKRQKRRLKRLELKTQKILH